MKNPRRLIPDANRLKLVIMLKLSLLNSEIRLDNFKIVVKEKRLKQSRGTCLTLRQLMNQIGNKNIRLRDRKMANSEYAKYVVSELKLPPRTMTPEALNQVFKFATRILWMDDKLVPVHFQMNTSWYLRPPETQITTSHTHDYDEIIGFQQ